MASKNAPSANSAPANPAPAVPGQPGNLFLTTTIPKPADRPLKIYAFDPSLGRFVGNCMMAKVRYEELTPGPVGEKIAVIDYDGTQKTFYLPVDLDDPNVMIGGGLDPSQSDPRFHQQMVYAVAMETLQRFETALGRRIRWRDRQRTTHGKYAVPHGAAQQLNLFPHAMCEANAFYSPEAHGILFGYFQASRTNPGPNLPGQTIFTCLSHDIIAHETTHAVLDGIRRYFTEPTNIDVPAFHEAFADLAALFAHFSHKEALLDTLQKTGGQIFNFNLRPEARQDAGERQMIQGQIARANPLIQLALQFGEASGARAGLRSALDTPPSPDDLRRLTEPHQRGAILVAAVFDAYFTIYSRRTAKMFQVYRAGGGSAVPIDLPAPLADLLAAEASRTAEEFFIACARAIDYCPPVDITFGDFLRALLTSHVDLHTEDPDGVRDALMQAFRLRGIVADGADFFSEDSLCWPKVAGDALPRVVGLKFGDPNGLTSEEADWNGCVLRTYAEANAAALGFDLAQGGIAAATFHAMCHSGQDGRLYVNMVVELVQTLHVPLADAGDGASSFPMRNGVTLLIAQDPVVQNAERTRIKPDPRVRFVISKLHSAERIERTRNYYARTGRTGLKASGGKKASDQTDNARFQIDFSLLHADVAP
jgi:hypothetical protein